ncbi:MAG: riboflavin synthase [Planctomycetaceae bacterium]|nr:riboflavin synthase [Planctomycetaceae bacterium]
MFTGIVEIVGRVASIEGRGGGVRLLVDAGDWAYRPSAGDSIAVSGVCLTHAPAAGDGAGLLGFDAVHETLNRTTLGDLRVGSGVNLEPSLTATSMLGGHFVQGHVDGIARVVEVQNAGGDWRTTFEADESLMPCVVPKGSIAIDGVSLTLATVDAAARRFSVALIPTTLELTTLVDLAVGDRVNIETDMIARTVVNYLKHWADGAVEGPSGGLTMEKLRDAGFLE